MFKIMYNQLISSNSCRFLFVAESRNFFSVDGKYALIIAGIIEKIFIIRTNRHSYFVYFKTYLIEYCEGVFFLFFPFLISCVDFSYAIGYILFFNLRNKFIFMYYNFNNYVFFFIFIIIILPDQKKKSNFLVRI